MKHGEERRSQLRGCLIAVLSQWGDRSERYLFHVPVALLADAAGLGNRARQNPMHHGGIRDTLPEPGPRTRLPEHHADRVNISPSIQLSIRADLLGRHVANPPLDGTDR